MDLRIKEVVCNLKNYNFDELGPYKMDEMEAKKLLDGLEDDGSEQEKMNDEQFMSNIICEICDYAVQHNMNPNETLATIAQNIKDALTVSTFENWGKE